MALIYEIKKFKELTLDTLYNVMQLRQEVFIVEQDCPYLDADGKDQSSYHVLGTNDKQLVSYIRIVPPGISYDGYSSIGRVVVKESVRKTGAGKNLMIYGIQKCKELYPDLPIKISAQCYLLKFYGDLGFKEIGEEYLEDDIPHKAMVYRR